MDYGKLVAKVGALYSILSDIEKMGLYQGEHTVVYTGVDGQERAIHIYVDGTEFQMFDTPAASNPHPSNQVQPDQES